MSPKRKCQNNLVETTKKRIMSWNKFYSSQNYGLGVECTKCRKWRNVLDYNEDAEVPENWECNMSTIDGQTGNCNIPAELSADDFVDELYVPGSLVWARSKGYPWWPAMVEDDPDKEEYHVKGESNEEDEYHVVFISKKVSRGWIPLGKVQSYLKPPPDNTKLLKGKKRLASLLVNAVKAAERAKQMTVAERLKKFSFAVLSEGKFPKAKANEEIPQIPEPPKKKKGVDITNRKKKNSSNGVVYGDSNSKLSTVPAVRDVSSGTFNSVVHSKTQSMLPVISQATVPTIPLLPMPMCQSQLPATAEDPEYDFPIVAETPEDPEYDIPIVAATAEVPEYDCPLIVATAEDREYDVPIVTQHNQQLNRHLKEILGSEQFAQAEPLFSKRVIFKWLNDSDLDKSEVAEENIEQEIQSDDSLDWDGSVPYTIKQKTIDELFSDIDSDDIKHSDSDDIKHSDSEEESESVQYFIVDPKDPCDIIDHKKKN